MFRFITARDHRVMLRINRWLPPRWVRRWMILASRAGDGWIWIALALTVLLFGGFYILVNIVADVLSLLLTPRLRAR